MKKLFVVLASVTLAVSAWGQSMVEANIGHSEAVDISECAAAIAHQDAIKVLERNYDPDTLAIIQRWSLSVLLLRDRGNLRRGYYNLITGYKSYESYPEYTVCWHYPLK